MIHELNFKIVYHTCGGTLGIEEMIVANGRDRSGALRLSLSKQFQEGDAEENGTSGEYYAPQGGVAPGVSG